MVAGLSIILLSQGIRRRVAFKAVCCHNRRCSQGEFATLCWELIVTDWRRVSQAARRGCPAQGDCLLARTRARFGSLKLVAGAIRSLGVSGPMDWILVWLHFLVRWLGGEPVMGRVARFPHRPSRSRQAMIASPWGRRFEWMTFLPTMDGFGGPPNRLGRSLLGIPGVLVATVRAERIPRVSSQASRGPSCPRPAHGPADQA